MRKNLYIFKHFAKSKKNFFCQYLSFSGCFPLSLKHWSPLIDTAGFFCISWFLVACISNTVQCTIYMYVKNCFPRETNQTKIYFLFFLKYLKFVPQWTKLTPQESCSWMNILINIEPEEWRGLLKEKNSCFIFLGKFVIIPKLTTEKAF